MINFDVLEVNFKCFHVWTFRIGLKQLEIKTLWCEVMAKVISASVHVLCFYCNILQVTNQLLSL